MEPRAAKFWQHVETFICLRKIYFTIVFGPTGHFLAYGNETVVYFVYIKLLGNKTGWVIIKIHRCTSVNGRVAQY